LRRLDSMRIIGDYLVFKYAYPERVKSLIPEVKISQDWTAVPFTLQTATILRSLGLPAPSPIQTEYDWPGKYTPFKHQILTSEFLTLNKRAFLLSGMGTGKTVSALYASDFLKKIGLVNRVLILSPLSTLDVVWGREIFQNFYHRKYAILHGTAAKRKELLKEPVDYYVINHHGVGVVLDELKDRPDIDMVIIDEVSFYRSSQNKSWKALKTLLTPDKWVWGMTGSPTPQAPTDAYGIAKLIKPENVPYSFTRFKQDTMLQVGPFKWVARKNAENIVAKVLSPSIRYALRDCIDLPPTIVQYRKVEMTTEQQQHYKKLLKDCMTEIRGVQVTAVNAAVLFGKIIQAGLGAIYGENKEVVKLDCSHRLNELKDLIEECDEKVIVFVPLTGALHMVASELRKSGYEVGVIEGDTSKHKRQEIFDAFQHGDKMKVLCANPQSMAHGVTLTAATSTIWFAPCTSNEAYMQANARTIRPGQTKTTNIINIFATKEEEKIYSGLQNKAKFQDIVLEIAQG
jgi:SNF2 family DNA or RNA helicase